MIIQRLNMYKKWIFGLLILTVALSSCVNSNAPTQKKISIAAPTPIPTPMPTSTSVQNTVIKLGIYGVMKNIPITDSKITYITTNSLTAVLEARPGTHVIFQAAYIGGPGTSKLTQWPVTNIEWVKSRFDYYEQIKDKPWEYGTYMGMEELFHPAIMAQWWSNPSGGSKGRYEALATWTIDGELNMYGINVKALRPWYISKYGSWNQTWWNNAKSSNNYKDPIVWEWSIYYAGKTYEMWNLHMHALGKKSFIGGINALSDKISFDELKSSLIYIWGEDNFNYILNNYDGYAAYQYPECISVLSSSCRRNITWSTTTASYLNSVAKGKIVWILTAHWPDSQGTDDKKVQLAEYKAVMPYVDVITLPYMSQMYATPYPFSQQSLPRLIEYCTTTKTC